MASVEKEVFAGLRLSGQTRRGSGLGPEMVIPDGRTYLPSVGAVRQLVARLQRDGLGDWRKEEAPSPGEWNALRLIDLATRAVHERWRRDHGEGVGHMILWGLEGEDRSSLIQSFMNESPPQEVLEGREELNRWLEKREEPWRAAEELFFVGLIHHNTAAAKFKEFFGSGTWARALSKPAQLEALFAGKMSGLDKTQRQMLEALWGPILAAPEDLEGQLRWIGEYWAKDLPEELLRELVLARDVMREERQARWQGGAPHRPTSEVYEYGHLEDVERYSADSDWMPRCVLLARNARVWLAQLSKRYGRAITHLDEIPSEALEEIARQGITGLWLIGIWERSEASATIKRMTGDADAVASAYSLFDYAVADELGGENALTRLKLEAGRFGVRIAADMVPNHVGIVSRWVYEHPEWFLSLPAPPYPSYGFTGPDLCPDPRFTIQIEDHYWDRTDAAVVFRRQDHQTGDVRFIYHGNDGTSMPWNDTAQLDYLNPDAREAVIRTIIDVARRCPIIRFDAAMTLVKRHVQRLWYPLPGSGGAIPSRAERSMSQEAFDAAMPREFWTEVVERVQQEVPDTLLLAEAFWMMEGYFVRNLGMHRVYNSAFMNMLRDEDNAGYRELMGNTLEYDPQILKRFVNFMNNPDEDTAIEQFGRGDKYFGVCTLMCTMPGLPMIGHGQIEGLTEKYGMEFAAPRLDESPDVGLVEAHRHRIFPLLHRRSLFAEVEHFRLFDARRVDGGEVVEDVFAYTNRNGEERALVVYLNRFADARFRVVQSVSWLERVGGDAKELRSVSLVDALGLPVGDGIWVRFKDQVSGLHYLRSTQRMAVEGLEFGLGAYGCQVLLDWEVLHDVDGRWAAAAARIGDDGVLDLDGEARRAKYADLHEALTAALDEAMAPDRDGAAREAWLDALCAARGVARTDEADDHDFLADELEAEEGLLRAFVAAEAIILATSVCGSDDEIGLIEDFALSEVLGEETNLVLAMLSLGDELYIEEETVAETLARWFDDPMFRRLVGVHEAAGTLWFRKEPFELWLEAMDVWNPELDELWGACGEAAEEAGWQVEKLLE